MLKMLKSKDITNCFLTKFKDIEYRFLSKIKDMSVRVSYPKRLLCPLTSRTTEGSDNFPNSHTCKTSVNIPIIWNIYCIIATEVKP